MIIIESISLEALCSTVALPSMGRIIKYSLRVIFVLCSTVLIWKYHSRRSIEDSSSIRKFADTFRRNRCGNVFQTAKSLGISWFNSNIHISNGTNGIVIPVGEKYVALAHHAIRILRLMQCNLPIEIAFFGDSDLSSQARKTFEEYENVTCLDLSRRVEGGAALLGWTIKPFAILFSSFEHVLMMDADVVWLKNPELLFESLPFRKSGALFFIDRIQKKSDFDHRQWLSAILPPLTGAQVQQNQLYQGISDHHQESGVVLVDKSRHLHGLLATCALNSLPRYRNEIQRHTHGEKETYWIGFEIAQEPYAFYDANVGTIGEASKSRTKEEYLICGHLLHFAANGEPLWFNDGIVVNKHTNDLRAAKFTHFSRDGIWKDICLISASVHQISTDLGNTLKTIIQMWNDQLLEEKVLDTVNIV